MSLQTMGEHRHADFVDVARVNPKLLHIWISTHVCACIKRLGSLDRVLKFPKVSEDF